MSNYKNSLKRTIKTGMNALCMDDATYRDMLERVSMRVSSKAKNSITKMTIAELEAVLNEMRNKGFAENNGKKTYSPKSARPMIQKITALWITMAQQGFVNDSSHQALLKFSRRQIAKKRKRERISILPASLESMSDDELSLIIEILKAWQKRQQAKIT